MAIDDDILFHFKRIDLGEFKEEYGLFLDTMDRIAADAAELADRDEKIGCALENGEVIIPPGVKQLHEQISNASLIGMTSSYGYKTPVVLPIIWYEMFAAKHTSLLFEVLTDGVIEVLEKLAPQEIQEKYIPKMVSGDFTGAMVMTEPNAGSDLGGIVTKATEISDGSYDAAITGEKIFITNPQSDVLIVLARDADKFEETKGTTDGLSMYLVPKHLDNGERNSYRIDRLEEKLGLHASPTGTLVFDNATSHLIGKKGEGMKQFFRLMNYERLAVAAQALGLSQGAFSYALDYADNEQTGRRQGGRKISEWPAVANMLVEMKVTIEAMRSLVYEAAQAMDITKSLESRLKDNPEDKRLERKFKAQIKKTNVLVWLAKYYTAELGQKVTSKAVQVLGGYGYIKDYPVERYFRDQRITPIYEGTSQIQASQVASYILRGRFNRELREMEDYFGRRTDKTSRYLYRRMRSFKWALRKVRYSTNRDYQLATVERITTELAQLYASYILMQQSRDSKRKRLVADIFASTQLKNESQLIRDKNLTNRVNNYFKQIVYNQELGKPN